LLEVSLLGEQHVERSGAAIDGRSSRSIALLAFLALHANVPQPRQRLAGMFWPDSTDAQARTNLRRELHNLRTLLDGDPALVIKPTTLMWREGPSSRVDVCVFRRERQLALAALGAGDDDAMLEHAAAAVNEYHGDLIPGAYDDWVLAERDSLRRQCVELCDRLSAGWQAKGELEKAVESAKMRVRLEPLEEVGYRNLMQLQADAGDRAGAMATFHRCAEVLERELQVAPSPATASLAERLLGFGGSTSPSVNGRQRGPGPPARHAGLVGRTRELHHAMECWHEAVEGHPRLLVVTGDAGVGKSRLVAELARQARADGAVVAATRCFGMARRVALAPVSDWLRNPAFQRVFAGLDDVWRVEVERLVPDALGAVRSGDPRNQPVPEPIGASRAMVDAWQRHRFFDGLARAVIAIDRPTLLVLDDLQWCDDETTAWLPFLLGRAGHSPLLVATTARSAQLAANTEVSQLLRALRSTGSLTELNLLPLGREGVRELGGNLLGRALAENEVSLLVTATGGYPLYVREVIRSATESGQVSALVSLADLSSVLRRRIEEASPHAREVAVLASAVGREFSLDLLTEASDLDADTVVRSVDELWRHGLFRELGRAYDFSHDLIRDSAYASVSPPRRWLLHRRLAQSLELLHAEPDADVAAQLAEQYDRGGRPDRAQRYYRRAAELAAAVFANSEAVRCFRRSLELLSKQPAGRGRDEQELDVLMAMSPPLNAIEGYASPQLQATLERAAQLAAKLGYQRELMSCLVGLFAVRFVQGQIVDSYDFARRAFDLVEAAPESAGQAHMVVAGSLTSLGRLTEALPHFEQARELSRGSVSLVIGTLPEVHALAWSSHARWFLGAPEQAKAACWEAVNLARSAEHPYSLAVALGYAATTCQLLDDRAAASEAAAELISLCDRYSFGFYGQWGMVVDGWARGGVAGIEQIQQGIEKLRSAGQLTRMPYWLYLLAELMVQAGRLEAGRAILDAALADAEQRDERWWLPEILRARARLLDGDAAVLVLRRAALLAKSQHSRTLQARCERDLARLGAGLENVPSTA
jgi:DNA-binding SARP family transcriptional activator